MPSFLMLILHFQSFEARFLRVNMKELPNKTPPARIGVLKCSKFQFLETSYTFEKIITHFI